MFQGGTVDVQASMGFITISTLPCCRCTKCCLDHYTSCVVDKAHDKFQGCTVYVQAATGFSQSLPSVFVYV